MITTSGRRAFVSLSDGFDVVSPSHVLADMDSEEPEAPDSLHRSAIGGDGGMSSSLSLSVVHNQQLLSWHQDDRALTSNL